MLLEIKRLSITRLKLRILSTLAAVTVVLLEIKRLSITRLKLNLLLRYQQILYLT